MTMMSVRTSVRLLLVPFTQTVKVLCVGGEKCVRAHPLKVIKGTTGFLSAVFPSFLVLQAQAMSSAQDDLRKNLTSVIQEADKLLAKYDFEKVYELLHPYKELDDVEMLWRLTKAAYEITRTASDKKKVKKLDTDGYQWITRAMTIDDKHPEVHKMMAVMIDSYHKHQGVKARLANTPEVKAHMIRASELNPSDPHPYYMLGWWYYMMANMPVYQVQLCKILFSTTINASFEEALTNFEKALERDKDHSRFYLMNLVMLSKTHLKLGHKDEALKYLQQVGKHPVITPEDKEACSEASTLMTQLGLTTELVNGTEVAA